MPTSMFVLNISWLFALTNVRWLDSSIRIKNKKNTFRIDVISLVQLKRKDLRMPRLNIICIFCDYVACFKDNTWHRIKQFFQVTTILRLGQLHVPYKPAMRFRFAVFACYFIKCNQSTPAYRHCGYT